MRTLLRHTQRGYYFQGPDRWTEDSDQAYDFRFVDRALEYTKTWELTEVELVFAFSDPFSITTVALEKASQCVA
jgi:hypothetical protein